jgi:hypothetical protein
MSFGIHRLRETFEPATKTRTPARPVHILIVSDNDLFSMLDSTSQGRSGWDVARDALDVAGGGATCVLELPEHIRGSGWGQDTAGYLDRIRAVGWNAAVVASMEELVEFARTFSRGKFGA